MAIIIGHADVPIEAYSLHLFASRRHKRFAKAFTWFIYSLEGLYKCIVF